MALPGEHMTQLIPSVAASMPSPRWRCGSWPYGPRSDTRAQRRAPKGSFIRAGLALTSRAWAACLFGEAVEAPRADSRVRSAVRGRGRGAVLRHWGRERTYRGRKPPIGVGDLPAPMTCCLPQCWSAAARTRRHWRTAVVRLGKPARAPAPGPSRGCCGWERGPRPLAPANTAAQRGRPPRETGPCVKPGPGLGLRPGQGPDDRAPTAGKPSRVFYGA